MALEGAATTGLLNAPIAAGTARLATGWMRLSDYPETILQLQNTTNWVCLSRTKLQNLGGTTTGLNMRHSGSNVNRNL